MLIISTWLTSIIVQPLPLSCLLLLWDPLFNNNNVNLSFSVKSQDVAPFLHFSVQNWNHYITSHGNWPNREWYVLLLLYGQKVEHDFCSEKASHPTRLEWANVLFHCPRHTHYTDLFISRECTSATTQPTTPPSSMQSPRHNYTTQQKVTCKFNVRFWYKLLLPDRFVNKYGSLLCKRAANKSPQEVTIHTILIWCCSLNSSMPPKIPFP